MYLIKILSWKPLFKFLSHICTPLSNHHHGQYPYQLPNIRKLQSSSRPNFLPLGFSAAAYGHIQLESHSTNCPSQTKFLPSSASSRISQLKSFLPSSLSVEVCTSPFPSPSRAHIHFLSSFGISKNWSNA